MRDPEEGWYAPEKIDPLITAADLKAKADKAKQAKKDDDLKKAMVQVSDVLVICGFAAEEEEPKKRAMVQVSDVLVLCGFAAEKGEYQIEYKKNLSADAVEVLRKTHKLDVKDFGGCACYSWTISFAGA